MSKLTFHFEAAEGVDAQTAATELERELAAIPSVSGAETRADQYRGVGPAEIIAGISLAVQLVNNSALLVDAISKTVDAVKALLQKLHAVKGASVDVGMKKVALDQLTDKDLDYLAKRIADAKAGTA